MSEPQPFHDTFCEFWRGSTDNRRYREVRKLGIEPGDKGLRNVMWDGETKRW